MDILITGGTGFIGRELLKLLSTHRITLVTRQPSRAKQTLAHADMGNIHYISSLDEFSDFNQFDAVINLAGEPIADKRWTSAQKSKICQSRWQLTEQLVERFHASTEAPSVFISGSAVGYYGDQQQHPFDESLQVNNSQFPHQVCARWEEIALRARSEQTRVCLLRTGIVLDPSGGALQKMLLPYKMGIGGPIGSGKQYMPWIHRQDMVKAIEFLLNTPHAQGAFNLCAPHPVTNREFSHQLAKVLKRPHFLFTPKWAIRLLMGESSVLLFDSARAKPKKLTELEFTFTYSRLKPALHNLFAHTE